jgi:hypothetical protein
MHFLSGGAGCLAAAALCLSMPSVGAPGALADYEAEAALIYKVGKFVHWPEAAFAASGGQLKLCIVGRDDFGASADGLAGQRLQGQVIAIERLPSVDASAATCHIAFISRSERGNLDAFLNAVSQSAVLTISDIEGFAAQGGMVGFSGSDGTVDLEINSAASKRAGLDIGAQLMQRATLVADARPGAKP